MSRTYSGQDVYLGDVLAYTNATVVDDPKGHTLRVRVRVQGKPGVWERVIELSDTQRLPDPQRTWRSWTGINADGDSVTLTAIPRKDCGCGGR